MLKPFQSHRTESSDMLVHTCREVRLKGRSLSASQGLCSPSSTSHATVQGLQSSWQGYLLLSSMYLYMTVLDSPPTTCKLFS